MSPRALVVGLALAAACRFDAGGVGAPSNMLGSIESSGGDGDDDDTTSTPESSTASVDAVDDTTDEGPATHDDTTGIVDDTTTTGDPIDGTTGVVDECADPPQFVLAIPADQANLGPPMMLGMQDGTPYAYSETAQAGTATFTFDVPCPQQYWFHGFVYDGVPGQWDLSGDNGADSYLVSVAGTNAAWHYGCQTGGLFPPLWQWQPISNNAGCIIGDDKLVVALPAGQHTIALVNNEAGTNGTDTPGSAAAIAVLVVTNDPEYSP
ncbi:MAG TPA: hypothetical protein VFG69_03450 [Nannocystaceae bacterium]|nr:hypothetical protein [Nannocystaceae bacterium]